MHCMIAWGPRPPHTSVPEVATKAFLAVLNGKSYTEAFPNVYVVALTLDSEWADLTKGLEAAAIEQRTAWMLISPPIPSGRYRGWLLQGNWDEINKRTG